MGINQSKIRDSRYWDLWRDSGAIGNMETAKAPKSYKSGDIVRLTADAEMMGWNQREAYKMGWHTEGMVLRKIPKGESWAGLYEIVTTSYTPNDKHSWVFRFPARNLESIPGDSKPLKNQMKKELLRRGYGPALQEVGLAA